MASADEKVKESMDENMSSRLIQCPQGWLPTPGAWPLVEVFSVCIDNIDGGDPCRLYGKITSAGTQGTRHIYNREKESYETIIPGGTASSLMLTGPINRSISALGGFSIDVALYDWDREISLGIIPCSSNENDRPLSYKVRGKHGCAMVNYAVWSEAVQATVEVTLIGGSIDGEEDPPAMVYGDIIACNSKFKNHESALFSCTKEGKGEMVKNNVIRPRQLIPLMRSVVAVPLDSTLIIKANLLKKKDDHSKAVLCDIYGEKGKKIRLDNNKAFCAAQDPTSEIANGTAMFRPQLWGTSEEYIYSKEGKNKILLQVTWGEVVQAVVKVKLIKGVGNGDPAKVYGHIIARHNQFENYERVLFLKKEDACFIEEGVRPGEAIPLLRSVVAVPWCPVPLGSILIIETNLKHNNNDDFCTTDQPLVIANCAEEFAASPSCSLEKLISSADGMVIRVKVSWPWENDEMDENVPPPEMDLHLPQYCPQPQEPSSFQGSLPEGWELVEVFSVCIDNIERGDPCLLHGKITSVDPSGLEHIYNGKTIIPGGTASVWLTLTGPTFRAISACGDFSIKVALYDSDDVEICCALIFWHDNCSRNNVYDQLLCGKLIGKHGCCVRVNYAVWRDAAEATVEVILIGGGGDGEEDLPPLPAKVYGDIIALNGNFKYYKSVLFSWSEAEMVKNNVNIRPGQLIPLLRSVVAVPLDSNLVIEANLKKDDHTVIASGTAEFPAQPHGISEKYIIGEEGNKHKILLQVTWGEVVKAHVNVTLIQKGGVSRAKVYGKLTASYDKFGCYERVLFNRKEKDDDDDGFIEEDGVRPGESIPLLRSVLAVPRVATLLTIKADLKRHEDASFCTAEDPVIANGAADFPTQANCTSDGKYIQGENGMAIRVQVTWGRVGGYPPHQHDGEDSFYSPNVPCYDARLGALAAP